MGLWAPADTVEQRLRQLMHEAQDGAATAEELSQALDMKKQNESDEKAFNSQVVKIFTQKEIALLLGGINAMQDTVDDLIPDSDTEEEDDGAAAAA